MRDWLNGKVTVLESICILVVLLIWVLVLRY